MMLRDDGELSVARHDDLRRQTYYQQLGEEGKSSVLMNLPIDQDGCEGAVIVNSWLTDDAAGGSCREDGSNGIPACCRRTGRSRRTRSTSTSCARSSRRASTSRASSSCARAGITSSACSPRPTGSATQATGFVPPADPEAARRLLRLYSQLDGYVGWFVGARAGRRRRRPIGPRPDARRRRSCGSTPLLHDSGYVDACSSASAGEAGPVLRQPTPPGLARRSASPRRCADCGRTP